MTLALSCQYGGKNSVIHFDFEQLSIIPGGVLIGILGVLPFSIHHFYVSKCN